MSVKIFYCYANEDKKQRAELEKHLGILVRQELITGWSDRNIDAGKEWEKEIDSNLNTANIILLLISPDFVHSDYCYSVEMKRALERHENGTARVIPIILRHGDYEGAAFNHLQALPTGKVPITHRKWSNRDEAFSDIAQGIRKVVKELHCEQCLYEGNVYFHRQQYKEALTAFEEAICRNPTNANAYIGKGQTLIHIALGDLSMLTFDKFIQNNIEDYNNLALAAFKQAIGLDPKNSQAYEGKAKALFHLFNSWPYNKEVLNAYEQAINLDPNNESAYIGRGKAFIYYSDYEQALKAFEKAIDTALLPNQDAYEGKADALFKLARYEDALAACEQSIQEFPKSGFIYYIKGNILYNLEHYREAFINYEKAIALNYQTAYLYTTLGNIFCTLERYQEALDAYERAIFLDPELSDAYKGKGNVLKNFADKAFAKVDELDDHPF